MTTKNKSGKKNTIMGTVNLAGKAPAFFSAMDVLFAMWNVKPAKSDGLGPCINAENLGLKCYRRHGNWSTIRNINRPTLIDLTFADGHRVYTVIIALNDDAVILDIGGQASLMTINEVTPYWSGEFLVLWRPSSIYRRDLQFGMRGADVAWLRDKLPKTQGASAVSSEPDTFDVELRERVIAFQRSHDLIGDGIVTPLTLIHLNNIVDKSAVPVLTNNP
jgi:general secretion pathway protein A